MKLLLILLLAVGCVSNNPQVAKKRTTKYQVGDCVGFDSKRVSKRVDGTIMTITSIKKKTYGVIMRHPRLGGPTHFTAVIGRFDYETKRVKCP